jgi:hypothetical protein
MRFIAAQNLRQAHTRLPVQLLLVQALMAIFQQTSFVLMQTETRFLLGQLPEQQALLADRLAAQQLLVALLELALEKTSLPQMPTESI